MKASIVSTLAMSRSACRGGAVLTALFALACSAGPGPEESLGEVSEAVCVNVQEECADVTQSTCNLEKWPDGIIWYEWFVPTANGQPRSPEDRQAIQAAMDRWEAASGGVIDFREDTGRTHPVRFRYISAQDAAFGPSGPMSYQTCKNLPVTKANPQTTGCFVALGASNADHEIGHGVGLKHTFSRNDRTHYLRLNLGANACVEWDSTRCDSPLKTGVGSGPFEYSSVMNYAVTDPDIERWDHTPICAGASCVACSSGPGLPYYQPTPADGSAVIEMYQDWWTRYQPLAKDVGADQPLSNALAPGVTMLGSPAVESFEGGQLDVFVRGSNNHIYVKNKLSLGVPATWTDWTDLGGTLVSDPGAVSWASGRVDVVAKGSNGQVYIKRYDARWSSWGSLGKPAGVDVASAPAITSWGPGRLDVFVRGSDDRLYQKTCSSGSCASNAAGWGAWQVRGFGTFWGNPAVVSRGVNLIDVFVHGKDHQVYGLNYTNGWGDFYAVNNGGVLYGKTRADGTCPTCSSPAVGARGNTMDIMIRGTDNRAWISSWSGEPTWPPFTTIGGQLSSSPGTVSRKRPTNRIDLVAFMADTGSSGENSLWWKTYP